MKHYLLQFFKYEHLHDDLKHVSQPFCELANAMDDALPDSFEKTDCLKNLLKAKDNAVRGTIFRDENGTLLSDY